MAAQLQLRERERAHRDEVFFPWFTFVLNTFLALMSLVHSPERKNRVSGVTAPRQCRVDAIKQVLPRLMRPTAPGTAACSCDCERVSASDVSITVVVVLLSPAAAAAAAGAPPLSTSESPVMATEASGGLGGVAGRAAAEPVDAAGEEAGVSRQWVPGAHTSSESTSSTTGATEPKPRSGTRRETVAAALSTCVRGAVAPCTLRTNNEGTTAACTAKRDAPCALSP